MFKSRFVLAMFCATAVLWVDFAEAQGNLEKEPLFKKPLLFRRAKAYQREQLKQELKGELYGELSDKLDKDVAVATETLRQATEAKVASESKKLQAQAQAHSDKLSAAAKAQSDNLAKQHSDAVNAVTGQGKAIATANQKFRSELLAAHEDAMKKHAQANKQARDRLAAMFKTLNDDFQTTSAKQAKANEKLITELSTTSEAKLVAKVEELTKVLAEQNKTFAAELAKKLSAENQTSLASTKAGLEQALAELTVKVKNQVDEAVAQLNAEQSETEPAPEPPPVPEEQDAAPAPPVTPQEESSEEE